MTGNTYASNPAFNGKNFWAGNTFPNISFNSSGDYISDLHLAMDRTVTRQRSRQSRPSPHSLVIHTPQSHKHPSPSFHRNDHGWAEILLRSMLYTVTVLYPSPIQGLCFPSSPLTSRSGFYFFFNDSHGTASVADLRVSVQLALPALSTDLRLGNRRNVFLRRRHLSPSPSGSQCYQRPRRMSWSRIRNWYPAACALAAQDDGLPSPGKVDVICM